MDGQNEQSLIAFEDDLRDIYLYYLKVGKYLKGEEKENVLEWTKLELTGNRSAASNAEGNDLPIFFLTYPAVSVTTDSCSHSA